MINSVGFFTDKYDLVEMTGMTEKNLIDHGVVLNHMKYGFVADVEFDTFVCKDEFGFDIRTCDRNDYTKEPYMIDLIDSILDYGYEYAHHKLGSRHYYIVYEGDF